MAKKPTDLEADLQRFYGVDLRAMYDGRLSVWRVARLAYSLPVEASTATGASPTAWAVREVFEAVAGVEHPALERERAKAGSGERAKAGSGERARRIAVMQRQIKADAARRARLGIGGEHGAG